MDQTGGRPRPSDGRRSRTIRVFIVDDHMLFRTGLRALLEEHGLEPVGDAGDAERGIAEIVRLRPDVVLMDLSLPGVSGVEATRRLTVLAPEVRILMFTAYTGDQSVVEAVEAGASGYLLKDASTEALIRAIEAAARGEPSLSPGATAVVLDRLRAYRFAPSSQRLHAPCFAPARGRRRRLRLRRPQDPRKLPSGLPPLHLHREPAAGGGGPRAPANFPPRDQPAGQRRHRHPEQGDGTDGHRGWLGRPGRDRPAARQHRLRLRPAHLRLPQAQRSGARHRRFRDRPAPTAAPCASGPRPPPRPAGRGPEAPPHAAEGRGAANRAISRLATATASP